MEGSKQKQTAFDNPAFDLSPEQEPQSIDQKGVTDSTQKEAPERDQWANPIEFLLSCVAMSVGLGNVWRFPFTAYANGGGAFLIPYIIVLFLIGKPVYYLELCLGQFSSRGPVKLWDVCPAFRGVGYGQVLAAAALVTYYVSLMGLAIYYMFASFSSELPWSVCGPEAINCYDAKTNLSQVNISNSVSSSEFYFTKIVLKKHENGLDDGIFAPDWKLALCLLTGWILIFLVLVKGVKSSGKASYFTALFPYVVLFILLGRGVTLPGAINGIKYFLTPQWDKLLDPKVWYAAVGQCFFSLSVGFACIPMFASYNPFKHNINRDVNIISLVDTGTSLLAGITIFAILGHLSYTVGIDDISKVVKDGGTSLAFISYPDVISRFDYLPQLFSVLFFLMLLTLGVGSASALTGAVITTICDAAPKYKRSTITAIVCIVGFLLGLFYTTPQGDYILTIVDSYAGTFMVYIFAFLMTIAVFWVYGYKNFTKDIEFMLEMKTNIYWLFCWVVGVPIVLFAIFVYYLIQWEPLKSGNYVFGTGANAFGASIVALAILGLIVCFIRAVYKRMGTEGTTFMEAVAASFRPSEKWCPANPIEAQKYWSMKNSENSNLYVLEAVSASKVNPKDPSLDFYRSFS